MTMQSLTSRRAFLFAFAAILFLSSSAFGAATITVRNDDAPGVGFRDPTPVSPVGGNNGTTLGQQRLIAAQHAADIWAQVLTSDVPIVISAFWSNNMGCTDSGATLASAGSIGDTRNFAGAIPNTLYPFALGNAISRTDLNGSTPEIGARFNLRIGQAGCLSSRQWYYGLDNNHGSFGVDLVTVALHEFGHGLGFASFTDESTGIQPKGLPSVYDRFLKDNTTGKFWPDMTDTERVASAINVGNLVWTGPQVTGSVPGVLSSGFDGSNHARVFAPNPVAPGSSVSHWDTFLTPNQLMEPNISNNLTHSVTVPQDLTLALLIDIGWGGTSGPPPTPTPTPTPPANDNFASAQVISGCSGSVTGTNVASTHEPGEPNHLSDGTGGTHSVWYQWQAPVSASVTIDTSGSHYDTALAVYTGSAVNNLVAIAKNDDVNPGIVQSSIVTFNATANTTYRIAVDGFDGGDGGDVGDIKLNWLESNCATPPQILLEQGGPVADQAAIFDSILHIRDPFLVQNTGNLFLPPGDAYTRVVIFVANLPSPTLTVNLVDNNGSSFNITPIDVHEFTDLPFSQVTFRLPNGMSPGTAKVKVISQGLTSNTATFRLL
jgi:hypothetical protein